MAPAAAPTAINPGICCRFSFSPRKPLSLLTTTIKKFPSSRPPPFLLLSGHRPIRLSSVKASSSSFNGFAHPRNFGTKIGNFDAESSEAGFRERVLSGLVLLRSLLPGGSWWNLEVEEEEGRGGEKGKRDRKKGVSVIVALRRMWMLVASDRWVIFLALTCLMIAALSEISIPHFLAASIFSAQSGESMIFYRNARLLVLLCFASGICRLISCMSLILLLFQILGASRSIFQFNINAIYWKLWLQMNKKLLMQQQ